MHAKYQFHTHPPHCTAGIPQASEAAWNDSHVILLGTIDHQLLVEYLRGPPLVVEIHDRSIRQVDGSKPALFGEETRDDVLGTHAFTAGNLHVTCYSQSPYCITYLQCIYSNSFLCTVSTL